MWTIGIAPWLPVSRGFGSCWTNFSYSIAGPDSRNFNASRKRKTKKEKKRKYWIAPARYKLRSHSHENGDQLDKPHWGLTIYINANRMNFVD